MNQKYKISFVHFIPEVGSVNVLASASDVNTYGAENLAVQFYDMDGEPVDVPYNVDLFELLEVLAVGFLIDEKHNPEVDFGTGFWNNHGYD